MKKALVTGGQGFIGKHLIQRLKRLQWEVYEFNGDIRNLDAVKKFVYGIKVDDGGSVFHLASYGNKSNETDIPRIYETNVIGTANLLSCAPKCFSFVFASTSSVYGSRLGSKPMSEEDDLAPNSDYAISKVFAEQMIQRKFRAAILRLFSVYGPGEHSNRLIPSIKEAIKNKTAIQTANPSAVRDFIHVEDVIDAFIHFSFSTGIFNIGTGTEWSVEEVCALANVELENTGENIRTWESPMWKADIQKSFNHGWTSSINFIHGLRKFLEE